MIRRTTDRQPLGRFYYRAWRFGSKQEIVDWERAAQGWPRGVEIGYHVREEHRRQGYATEALRALLAWALEDPEVKGITAETEAQDVASIGLLKKLGFARVGVGSWSSLVRFVVLRQNTA